MNIITGCLAATEGSVTIGGHDIFEEPVAAKKLVGYLPEQPPLYQDMTPREYRNQMLFARQKEGTDIRHTILEFSGWMEPESDPL